MINFVANLSAPIKVLLLNNFGFNLGFYMLLPYLSRYITGELGYAAGFAGFVMGFRMMSQQGLFLVGGTLADRFNYRTVIMAGCGLRVLGFALFGLVASKWGIVAAAFMTGFAAALFTPAYQALMARLTEDHPQREKVYALQNVSTQAGAFLGPLCGLFLLGYGFSAVCVVAAAVFFLLLLLQWRYLPTLEGSEHGSRLPVWNDWLTVFKRGNFIMFCFAMSAYYLMFNQLYILLPLGVPNERSVAAIFTLSAVMGVVLQMPISGLTNKLLSRPARLGLGLAIMGCSFPLLRLSFGSVADIPIGPLLTTVVLTIGMLIVFPTAISMVPELGGERNQGVCFGVFYLFAGIAGASGGGLTAWLWELNPEALLTGLFVGPLLFAALLWYSARLAESRRGGPAVARY
ncbi:MFS transporter [Deltaproteobacteria bacterium OttesenSCG-928-K17]|nr:MFS transporter [Deltaproteobacteria bacterium OttesenSCG-928-K17]